LKLTVGRFGRADTRGAGVDSSSESLSDSDESDSGGSSWLLMSDIASLLLHGESSRLRAALSCSLGEVMKSLPCWS